MHQLFFKQATCDPRHWNLGKGPNRQQIDNVTKHPACPSGSLSSRLAQGRAGSFAFCWVLFGAFFDFRYVLLAQAGTSPLTQLVQKPPSSTTGLRTFAACLPSNSAPQVFSAGPEATSINSPYLLLQHHITASPF